MTDPEPLDQPQEEPLFVAIPRNDPALVAAVARARSSAGRFRDLIAARKGPDVFHTAKLRFRDPEQSASLGEDRYFNLWVASVTWNGQCFVGVPFEVPKEILWIRPGEEVRFQDEDLIDWMVNDEGHIFGAFSVRVIREALPTHRRAAYDRYIGAKLYEPTDA